MIYQQSYLLKIFQKGEIAQIAEKLQKLHFFTLFDRKHLQKPNSEKINKNWKLKVQ